MLKTRFFRLFFSIKAKRKMTRAAWKCKECFPCSHCYPCCPLFTFFPLFLLDLLGPSVPSCSPCYLCFPFLPVPLVPFSPPVFLVPLVLLFTLFLFVALLPWTWLGIPWLGLVSLCQIWDFYGYSLNTLKYPKMGIRYFFPWYNSAVTSFKCLLQKKTGVFPRFCRIVLKSRKS